MTNDIILLVLVVFIVSPIIGHFAEKAIKKVIK